MDGTVYSYLACMVLGMPLLLLDTFLNVSILFSVLFLATKHTGLCGLTVSVSVNIASMGSSRRRRVFVELHTEMSDPKS